MKKTSITRGSIESVLVAIGKYLYHLRIEKGYTSHADFAADFNLPRIQYWRMEKGKANLTLKSLQKVLSIHELSVEEFFVLISDGNKKIKRARIEVVESE